MKRKRRRKLKKMGQRMVTKKLKNRILNRKNQAKNKNNQSWKRIPKSKIPATKNSPKKTSLKTLTATTARLFFHRMERMDLPPPASNTNELNQNLLPEARE